MHRGNRLLMVKHRQQEAEWWCLPGSAVEAGEYPAQAALRELKEECGVEGSIVRQTSYLDYGEGDETFSFLVDIGPQTPRLGDDPEQHGQQQILVDMARLALAEIPERDRAFLWAAGLLGVPEFSSGIDAWGAELSCPQRAPF